MSLKHLSLHLGILLEKVLHLNLALLLENRFHLFKLSSAPLQLKTLQRSVNDFAESILGSLLLLDARILNMLKASSILNYHFRVVVLAAVNLIQQHIDFNCARLWHVPEHHG